MLMTCLFLLIAPSVCAQTTRVASVEVMPPRQRVTFDTDEKTPITIIGWYTPPDAGANNRREPMVILLHEQDEDRSSFDALAPVLHQAHFAVLAIDLRGHGQSAGAASLKLKDKIQQRDARVFRDMDKDVEAAYRWLAARPEADAARFVLVGRAMGAGVAMEYATRDRSVDAVVMITPASLPGVDLLASARKYNNRKLLVLALSQDRSIADEIGRLVAGSRVDALARQPLLSAADVKKRLVDFLVDAAGPFSASTVVASLKGKVYYEAGSSQAGRLSPGNLRVFSSPSEATARGYQPPRQRQK